MNQLAAQVAKMLRDKPGNGQGNGAKGPSKSAKRRARRRKNNGGGAAGPSSAPTPAGFSGMSQAKLLRFQMNEGGTRVSIAKYECWGDILVNSGTGKTEKVNEFKFDLTADNAPRFLKLQAKNWGRFTVKDITLHYRPDVGTSQDGAICLGVDWNADNAAPKTVKDTYILSPNRRTTLWQPFDIHLPKDLLNSRKFYPVSSQNDKTEAFDHVPFVAYVGVRHKENTAAAYSIGELWISWAIEFHDPVIVT